MSVTNTATIGPLTAGDYPYGNQGTWLEKLGSVGTFWPAQPNVEIQYIDYYKPALTHLMRTLLEEVPEILLMKGSPLLEAYKNAFDVLHTHQKLTPMAAGQLTTGQAGMAPQIWNAQMLHYPPIQGDSKGGSLETIS